MPLESTVNGTDWAKKLDRFLTSEKLPLDCSQFCKGPGLGRLGRSPREACPGIPARKEGAEQCACEDRRQADGEGDVDRPGKRLQDHGSLPGPEKRSGSRVKKLVGIVNRPEEAIDCFQRTRMDTLVVGKAFSRKET